MSRIGNLPVVIPAATTVTVTPDNVVTVKGPKGQLVRTMRKEITITIDNGSVIFTRSNDSKDHKALHGLTRALVNNMVIGVNEGYKKTLELVGVGYKATLQGKKLVLSLGYSHPVEIAEVEGLVMETPAPNRIVISGIDKEKVGALAAEIRTWRKPEPYKGKGIKYDYEVIRRKEGKTGKK